MAEVIIYILSSYLTNLASVLLHECISPLGIVQIYADSLCVWVHYGSLDSNSNVSELGHLIIFFEASQAALFSC